MRIELKTKGEITLRKMYFVGIGGIGMSALARYFADNGVKIYGYDRTETTLTQQLSKGGMTITYKDELQGLPTDLDLVVYTPAIPETNNILHHLKQSETPVLKRAEVLGAVADGKRTIAVAGTHGKTTTSALTTYLFRSCGVDTTAILGGIIPQFNSNYIHGDSDWLVVEADEYDRSFLHLHPEVAIVTSLDADHLDIYGSHAEMMKTYIRFMEQVKSGGHLILHWKVVDLLPASILETLRSTRSIKEYGRPGINGTMPTISYQNDLAHFQWIEDDNRYPTTLKMPGEHNVANALAAIHACQWAGVSPKCCAEKLPGFRGIWRRFEVRHLDSNHALIDDYAHHPTELTAAIHTARSVYPEWSITGIFQPHLYSRTKDFYLGFAEALDLLDETWILDIYPAREQPMEGVTSRLIKDNMRSANVHLASKNTIVNQIKILDQQVIMILGAGDLYLLIPDLIRKITDQQR